MDLIPGLERPAGEGNGNPLHHSCLGNPTDRGAWRAAVMRLQSQIRLSDETTPLYWALRICIYRDHTFPVGGNTSNTLNQRVILSQHRGSNSLKITFLSDLGGDHGDPPLKPKRTLWGFWALKSFFCPLFLVGKTPASMTFPEFQKAD